MSDCIFCDIADGKAPASFVYRDDVALAFMDISSLNTGQVVVIPIKHFSYLADMDETTGQRFFTITTRVCQAIRQSGIPCDGINLFLADGQAAGQEIFHVHFLVIPRTKGDAMKITGEWTSQKRHKLDKLARKIQQAYKSLY
jgi:histidine triad (HIT) family protein